MSSTSNPRSFRSNRDHALQAQLEAGALETTVGRVVEYVKENHVAPILADAHASKRQKTTARAEINMLNTLQKDITTVLKDVTNAQAKNSGISNAAYAASAQSRLQNQTRFPCDTMASKAFSQTKKDLKELQERSRNRSSRSGAQGASSKRKASAVAPSSSTTSGSPSTTDDPTPFHIDYRCCCSK